MGVGFVGLIFPKIKVSLYTYKSFIKKTVLIRFVIILLPFIVT